MTDKLTATKWDNALVFRTVEKSPYYDLPEVFTRLADDMAKHRIHCQLVKAEEIIVLQETVEQMAPPTLGMPSKLVFRRMYHMTDAKGEALEDIMVSARTLHPVNPLLTPSDFDAIDCYLWDPNTTQWVFLFRWDTNANTFAFQESAFTYVDPLDNGVSYPNPDDLA